MTRMTKLPEMVPYRLLIPLLVIVISLAPVADHPLLAAPPFQPVDQVALRIEPESEEGIPGSQVLVAVIAENAAAMAGLQFRLVYDGAVAQAVSVESGNLPTGTLFLGNPNASAGQVAIAVASASSLGEANETVTLATITFDLLGAPGSMTDLVLDQVLVADTDAQPLPFTTANGMITITDTVVYQPSFTLHQDPADGATGVKIGIARRDGANNGEEQNVLVETFQVRISYDGSCLNILEVRGLDFAVSDVSIDNSAGVTTFNGSSATGLAAPAALGHLLTRLVGGGRQPCSMSLEVLDLRDGDGNPIEVDPASLSLEMLRGDARADGVVNVADALIIAQYLVGSRDACTAVIEDTTCLHPVNAGSVAQDGLFDLGTIADSRLIVEYLLGLLDEFYNVAPSP